MSHRILAILVGGAASLFLTAALASAQDDRPRPPHPPPPEAFAACEAQEEGSLCAVETPHGTLEGTCRAPRGERLVCVPNGPPPGPPPGPRP